MLIYYRFCHPHGPIYWQRKRVARREPVKYCGQMATSDQASDPYCVLTIICIMTVISNILHTL